MILGISYPLFWLILGVALLGLEVATSTFTILFFGVAALVTALAAFLGLENVSYQIIFFSLMGLISAVILRTRMMHFFHKENTTSIDGIRKAPMIVEEDMPVGSQLRITHQGVPWTAVNGGSDILRKGEKAVIDRVDGVKLILKRQ